MADWVDPPLEVTNVIKDYPGKVRALDRVSFRIAAGERACLLGPNGAGKTTLIRLLTGALSPSYGQVRLFGLAVEDEAFLQARRRVGIVPQLPGMYRDLLVKDYLQLVRELYGRGDISEVVEAFRDVQRAEQDKASAVNEANTYRNRVVNEAKGTAAQIVQGAAGYREQAVRDALGEAARFNQLYPEYRRAPGVTRERLYIETMQRILSRSNKVVIDAKGATAPIILPPDVFRAKSPPPAAAPAPAADPRVAR